MLIPTHFMEEMKPPLIYKSYRNGWVIGLQYQDREVALPMVEQNGRQAKSRNQGTTQSRSPQL